MSKRRIGLIGIGAMGRGVAANLLSKGFDVTGFDVQTTTGRSESLPKVNSDMLKDVLCFGR